MTEYLFELGRQDVDAVAAYYADKLHWDFIPFLKRHRCGDFGIVDEAKVKHNMLAIQKRDGMITSHYRVSGGLLSIMTSFVRGEPLVTSILLVPDSEMLPMTREEHIEHLRQMVKELNEEESSGIDFLD